MTWGNSAATTAPLVMSRSCPEESAFLPQRGWASATTVTKHGPIGREDDQMDASSTAGRYFNPSRNKPTADWVGHDRRVCAPSNATPPPPPPPAPRSEEMERVRELLRKLKLALMQLSTEDAQHVAQTYGMKPGRARQFVRSFELDLDQDAHQISSKSLPNHLQITSIRLDELRELRPTLGLGVAPVVKLWHLDVEGAEIIVLRSATRLFEEGRIHRVMLEVQSHLWHRFGVDVETGFNELRQLFKGWQCTIACNGVSFHWESVAGKRLGFDAGTAPQVGTCNFTKSIQAASGYNPPMDVYCEAPAIQHEERWSARAEP